jgi:nucleoside phosphorylase
MSAPEGAPAGSDLPVAIVTALPEELGPILARARGLRRVARGGAGPRAWEGRLSGVRVLLTCTGDGARDAREGIREVLGAFPVSRWIGAGFAGALSPGLEPGTVLVARALYNADGTLPAPLDAAFATRALAAGGARAATIVSTAALVPTAAAKARLRDSFCRDGDEPAAADLESAGWAEGAPGGMPGALVRVVLDGALEDLPDLLTRANRPGGGIDRAGVVLRALRRPSGVGKLLAMRRRARLMAERLADFLERFAALGF